MSATITPSRVDEPSRGYGDKVAAVEPGGVEFIPLAERHGSPMQLVWTWASPNLEFATVFVGGYCSGLVRQFGISRVIIGEVRTYCGGHDWLADNGVDVEIVDDPVCAQLMTEFIAAKPELWNEDIGAQ